MYSLIRPLLFKLPPELSHSLCLNFLKYLPKISYKNPPAKPIKCLGLEFPHTIGLAAGLDKNGEYLSVLERLGFAFIEIGTVTPKAQVGNPQPRLFRLVQDEALINRMGFNNVGVEGVIANLSKSSYRGILGINIGKNKDTSLNEAAHDYLFCLKKLYAHASYVTINISSPNTPGLRELQHKNYLDALLTKLVEASKFLADEHKKQVPLVVKISPDEKDEDLKVMAMQIKKAGLAGIIATNTTSARTGLKNEILAKEQGGLSGKPLTSRSSVCIKILRAELGDELAIIGVGGIDSPQRAVEKLQAGASLIQIYTGLIYKGPNLVRQLIDELNNCQ